MTLNLPSNSNSKPIPYFVTLGGGGCDYIMQSDLGNGGGEGEGGGRTQDKIGGGGDHATEQASYSNTSENS
jgi:hypothetical protein